MASKIKTIVKTYNRHFNSINRISHTVDKLKAITDALEYDSAGVIQAHVDCLEKQVKQHPKNLYEGGMEIVRSI